MFAKFQSSYCHDGEDRTSINKLTFFGKTPDCSWQNDSLKTGTPGIRLEMEVNDNIPEKTAAFSLILQDGLVDIPLYLELYVKYCIVWISI